MGVFGNKSLNEATAPTGGGYYFLPGEYEIEITAFKRIVTRKKGPMILAETLILESNNADRPVGSRPTWAQLLEGDSADVAPQNIKMFLSAACLLNIFADKDAKDIAAVDWDTFGGEAIASENPLAGCRGRGVATGTTSKKGSDFTKTVFTPPKNPTEFQIEMAAEARK